MLYRRIRALANETETNVRTTMIRKHTTEGMNTHFYLNTTHIQVWVFVEDMAASGGYYLACAGDRIYADNNSMVQTNPLESTPSRKS
jgi:hypothetical protein